MEVLQQESKEMKTQTVEEELDHIDTTTTSSNDRIVINTKELVPVSASKDDEEEEEEEDTITSIFHPTTAPSHLPLYSAHLPIGSSSSSPQKRKLSLHHIIMNTSNNTNNTNSNQTKTNQHAYLNRYGGCIYAARFFITKVGFLRTTRRIIALNPSNIYLIDPYTDEIKETYEYGQIKQIILDSGDKSFTLVISTDLPSNKHLIHGNSTSGAELTYNSSNNTTSNSITEESSILSSIMPSVVSSSSSTSSSTSSKLLKETYASKNRAEFLTAFYQLRERASTNEQLSANESAQMKVLGYVASSPVRFSNGDNKLQSCNSDQESPHSPHSSVSPSSTIDSRNSPFERKKLGLKRTGGFFYDNLYQIYGTTFLVTKLSSTRRYE